MKQVKKAEEISNIAFGFMASKALFVALHCNIFSLLSKNPLSSLELAEIVEVPENRISTICTALTSIGLLIRKNDTYNNSIGAEKYLVKGAPYDFGDYLRLQIDRQMYGFMQQLEGVVTNNMNKNYIDSYAKWMGNKKEAELYSESQHAGSLGPGLALSRMVDFSNVNSLLDVAGGTGGFAIRLCQQNSNLNVTILDFPNVIKLGMKKVFEASLSDRIKFIGCDALDYNWPTKGFDAVLMSYLFNGVPGEEIPKLICKAKSVMNNGGIFIIHDFMVEDDRNGPHLAALWQLQHLAFTPTAKSITPKWISKTLVESGFSDIFCDNLIPGMTKVIRAIKPIA
jgi:ubiquinone/menaquinone biosynthesis C-methylase UbiE/predicted transcriptional regulator